MKYNENLNFKHSYRPNSQGQTDYYIFNNHSHRTFHLGRGICLRRFLCCQGDFLVLVDVNV